MLGVLIFVMWIYSAEDSSDSGNEQYPLFTTYCSGWFKKVKEAGETEYDCYGLLIGFGVVLGLAWIGSGAFGFFVSRVMDWKTKIVFFPRRTL